MSMEQLAKPWGELALYYDFASRMWWGQLPYRDFFPEYPPFSLFFFWLANLGGERWFTLSYYSLILFFLFLSAIIVIRLKGNPYAMIASAFVLGGLFFDRFDLFPAFFVLLSFYLLKKYWQWAFVVLGFGFLTKVYPILFLPILFFSVGWRHSLKGFLYFLIPIILTIGLIIGYGGGDGLKTLYQRHFNRGIQIESLRAMPMLIQALQGRRQVIIEYKNYTYEIK